ncbi:TonB-dependent receptor [Capnocytophaga stomatis]|uniref:TonB-dependent receptor n=1 Tax=Capnocytophaga stomatis TaxID=1848904 RepID=UPI0019502FE3|nr:TonB-dependent receptor [Capnocytophaga stomatis]GIJ94828.1 TonB-dependent receptor [Capnocytophaga stomatis]
MKNIKARFLILLLFCFGFSFADLYAQQPPPRKGTLSGKVIYTDGTPADMVTVFIKSVNRYTQTDEEGFFKIEHLPIGKHYEIEVKTFGNESVKVKVHFTKSNQQITIRLNNNQGISLGEVAVSGSSKGRQAKEQGYAMNVISTKEAILQNIQTTELLGRSAGVKIRQSAGMGSDISFNLNGLTGNSVRIFIDGIPIRNYGRSFSLSSIPPSMIERIEVYKGVLPAELSEDALGGGINVVLKKEMSNSLTTSYSYGSFNTHQWDLNGTYRDKKSGFTANLSSFYNYTDNNYKVWGETIYVTDNTTGEYTHVKAKRFHDKYYSSGIKSNFGFTRKKWADEFLLGFMFSETEKDIQTGATMQVVYGNRRTEYNSRMASLQYKKNDLFFKGLDVSTFTTYSKTNRQVIDTVPYIYTWEGKRAIGRNGKELTWQQGAEAGAPTLAMNDERNFANRSNVHYHITRNHAVGVSYFLGAFTRDIDDPTLPQHIRNRLDQRKYNKQIIGFNYDLNLFSNKLKASLFYKLYRQKVYLTEYDVVRRPNGTVDEKVIVHDRKINDKGYGMSLSYAITPKIMVSASVEKAIRLPGSTELLGNTSEGVTTNLSLKPEYSNNANLGLTLNAFIFGKHEIGGEINLFIRDIRDMILRGVPRTNDDFFRFENLGKVISKGADAELRYNWNKRLFINANVSYTNALFNLEHDPDTGLKYAHYRSRLRNTPYFTANVNAEYLLNDLIQKKSRLAINYNFGYTHEFFKEWEVYGAVGKAIIPTQPLHDVGLTYTFPNQKWTLAFNAKNIFDTQVFDNFALQKPGRAIFGKLTFSVF